MGTMGGPDGYPFIPSFGAYSPPSNLPSGMPPPAFTHIPTNNQRRKSHHAASHTGDHHRHHRHHRIHQLGIETGRRDHIGSRMAHRHHHILVQLPLQSRRRRSRRHPELGRQHGWKPIRSRIPRQGPMAESHQIRHAQQPHQLLRFDRLQGERRQRGRQTGHHQRQKRGESRHRHSGELFTEPRSRGETVRGLRHAGELRRKIRVQRSTFRNP